MEGIPDDLLIETYYMAIERKLSTDFVRLLLHEITKRNLSLKTSI
jgi:hypothetical protein